MQEKFSTYRLFFIINIISLAAVTVLMFYFLFGQGNLINWTRTLFSMIGIVVYSVNDLAGLSIIKRLRDNEHISFTIVNRLMISIFFQFILQLLLAYELMVLIEVFFVDNKFDDVILPRMNPEAIAEITIALIIFLSSTYNIYSTIRLITVARKARYTDEEMIENIGSGN